jgi:hypothetical protein
MTSDSDIAELKTGRDWLRHDIDALQKSVEKLTEAILGNGKPGILSRTNRIEAHIKIQWFCMGAVLTVVVAKVVCAIIGINP